MYDDNLFDYNNYSITKKIYSLYDIYNLFDLILSKYNIDNCLEILLTVNKKLLQSIVYILGYHEHENIYNEFSMNVKIMLAHNVYYHLLDYYYAI